MPELMTTEDVAERYKMERHAAADYMKKLPYFTVGRRIFVRRSDLIEWEKSRIVYPVQRRRGK